VIPHAQRPVAQALGDPIAADFRNFLFAMWRFLKLPSPTEIQYDIAEYLQNGPRRRMVEAFRGVGKSWITAGFVLWRLYKNPNERILVVSASKDRADAFSTFLKRCIAEWELLQHLIPEPGRRDSNIAFDVGGSDAHQAPSVRSVGINGQMTGGRATIIVADDVETPKNALTQTMRDKLAEAVKEFDAVLVPNGEIVYLGTPQTEMSLYNSLPERGYEIRVWPSRYPASIGKHHGRLAPIITDRLERDPSLVGQPTDPRRFTHVDLMEREASYGRSGFALQFQLDTSMADADRYPLKLSDLMVMGLSADMGPVKTVWGSSPEYVAQQLPAVGLAGDRWYRPMFLAQDDKGNPQYSNYQGVMMAIDPSGRGADETGYAVVAMLNGYLYLLEAGGLKGGYDDDTLTQLAQIAKRNKVKWIRIEPNFGDGMFDKLFAPFLTRIYPCTIDPDAPRSSIQKEKRIIDTLEPVLNQHRLVVNEKIVQEDFKTEDTKYQLFYQLTRLTREKGALGKDDRLDALAQAVAYWVEVMDKDTSKILEEHRQALLDKDLETFFGSVMGVEPAPLNWMSDMR
jgi:hypothetical protein